MRVQESWSGLSHSSQNWLRRPVARSTTVQKDLDGFLHEMQRLQSSDRGVAWQVWANTKLNLSVRKEHHPCHTHWLARKRCGLSGSCGTAEVDKHRAFRSYMENKNDSSIKPRKRSPSVRKSLYHSRLYQLQVWQITVLESLLTRFTPSVQRTKGGDCTRLEYEETKCNKMCVCSHHCICLESRSIPPLAS